MAIPHYIKYAELSIKSTIQTYDSVSEIWRETVLEKSPLPCERKVHCGRTQERVTLGSGILPLNLYRNVYIG